MKKLLNSFVLALAAMMVLVSCKEKTDPFASGYNPGATTLNTSHDLVGKMYGPNGQTDNFADAYGIVFAVSPEGDTAYLCAFTDVMYVGSATMGGSSWYSYEFVWGSTLTDTMPFLGCTSSDGRVNSEIFMNSSDMKKINPPYLFGNYLSEISAIEICKEYFKRPFDANDRGGLPDETYMNETKGLYYLPSAEELEALVNVADKINELYLNGTNPADTVVNNPNGIRYQGLGGDNGYAYWSSTEFNAKCAWYRIVSTKTASYLDKKVKSGGGLGNMRVRPICKVAIR